MDEKDRTIQELMKDAARWRQRALSACEKACFNCEEYRSDTMKPCSHPGCIVYRIMEEAAK